MALVESHCSSDCLIYISLCTQAHGVVTGQCLRVSQVSGSASRMLQVHPCFRAQKENHFAQGTTDVPARPARAHIVVRDDVPRFCRGESANNKKWDEMRSVADTERRRPARPVAPRLSGGIKWDSQPRRVGARSSSSPCPVSSSRSHRCPRVQSEMCDCKSASSGSPVLC